MLKVDIKKNLITILYLFLIIIAIILSPTIIDIILNIGRFIGSISREVSNCYL